MLSNNSTKLSCGRHFTKLRAEEAIGSNPIRKVYVFQLYRRTTQSAVLKSPFVYKQRTFNTFFLFRFKIEGKHPGLRSRRFSQSGHVTSEPPPSPPCFSSDLVDLVTWLSQQVENLLKVQNIWLTAQNIGLHHLD